MDGFDIATDRISTAATGVESVGTALHTEITTMDGILADIGAGWHSTSAAPRFVAAMDGYLADARVLSQALISHGGSLAATSTSFAQAEEAIAASTPAVTG
ncbi:MAG: WXG100 family type VII secretion target [Nakamurella sp.]